MTVVVGTAGHIDHGKTTLLRVLTGTDTDRLPEEQRRGLTIDVGYAHFAPDDGAEIDFVDVPGHDKLVGNMLVGAGEIDACLLVVAADDGPRAQTWEHLGLLDALGIDQGLVVITKTDLVESERSDAVVNEMRERLAVTCLAGAPITPVSSASGDGLDALRSQLAGLRDRVEARQPRTADHRVRLAIDRVFSVRGRGVVVTGSSRGRRIRNAETLRLLPEGSLARVRELQVHDAAVDVGPLGGRMALNLAGIRQEALHRGQVLVSGGPGSDIIDPRASRRLLVALHRPAELLGRHGDDPWPPADGRAARLHIGTAQRGASVGHAGRDAVMLPDGHAIAMLRLDGPVATAPGERFVLRRPPPAGLMAGGVVLDADPARGRSRQRQSAERLERLASAVECAHRGAIIDALLELHGLLGSDDELRVAPDVDTAAVAATLSAVADHHGTHPDQGGLPLATVRRVAATAVRACARCTEGVAGQVAVDVVAALLDAGRLIRRGDDVSLPGHELPSRDPALDAAMDRLVELLDVPAPPPLRVAGADAGCPADGIRELERSDRIIVVGEDLAWSADAFATLRDRALELAADTPLTPAALRDVTGTSRKYVMALLEDLDRRGILRRTPAGHVPGPRAQGSGS